MIHTDTPWRVVNGVDVQAGPVGCLAYVSTAGGRGRTLDEAQANAEFLCRAVNAHEALVAALRPVAEKISLVDADFPLKKMAKCGFLDILLTAEQCQAILKVVRNASD